MTALEEIKSQLAVDMSKGITTVDRLRIIAGGVPDFDPISVEDVEWIISALESLQRENEELREKAVLHSADAKTAWAECEALREKVAALEAALSAAEPVARQYRAGSTEGKTGWRMVDDEHYAVWEAMKKRFPDSVTLQYRDLYAAPPAPSVAVKVLEWDVNDSWNVSKTVIGTYVVRPCLATNYIGQWLLRRAQNENSDKTLYSSEDEAKAAAQADYEARIRSALSAQVQDVAKPDDELFWRLRLAYLRGAEWRETSGSMHMVGKAADDYADKITSPLAAAPAKQEG